LLGSVEGEARVEVDDEPRAFGEGPAEVEDARKRFEEQAEQRLGQLRSELELNAKLNASLADAVGLDTSKLPAELITEIEETAKRALEAEPPPLARR
jgi:hypothetical protein